MRRCEISVSNSGHVQYFQKGGQEEWGRMWQKDVITYAVIKGTEDLSGDSQERTAMNLAMTTWDLEIRARLQVAKASDNPDITVKFATKDEDPYFAERPSVLAYAFFPGQGTASGRIVFNEEHEWSMDGKPKKVISQTGQEISLRTYNIITVLVHEIGHSLGLTHSEGLGLEKTVMYPYYNGVMDLTQYDKNRIRAVYGQRNYKHDGWYDRLLNWLSRRKRRF